MVDICKSVFFTSLKSAFTISVQRVLSFFPSVTYLVFHWTSNLHFLNCSDENETYLFIHSPKLYNSIVSCSLLFIFLHPHLSLWFCFCTPLHHLFQNYIWYVYSLYYCLMHIFIGDVLGSMIWLEFHYHVFWILLRYFALILSLLFIHLSVAWMCFYSGIDSLHNIIFSTL